MSTSVRIAIIGAGSAQFSAEIIRDLCVNAGLAGSHVSLMDVDGERLDMAHRLGTMLSEAIGGKLTFDKTTNREAALRGADFVINTAQVGGHDWIERQRALAERHGYYRGARIHDIPQMQFFVEVARDIERLCPNALLIQSANPVFEGCTVMHRETSINILGLCHGHYGYEHIARVLGLELDAVSAQTKGFNHWIWMTDFRYRGKDAYPLLDEWIATKAEDYWAKDNFTFGDNQLSRAAVDQYKLFGLMPIGDTPRFVGWWYHTDLATKQKWYGRLGGFDSEIGWSQYLERMKENIETIKRAISGKAGAITEIFPPRQGHEQIVPIIDSLVNDHQASYQINVPNRGQVIQGFPEDLVIECQGLVSGAGIRPTVTAPLPRKIVVGEMIPRWRKAECAVEAVRTHDPDYLLLMMTEDPRTRSRDQAERFLKDWLSEPQNEHIRELFGAGRQGTA
jgi:alpha-galactosidase/6-phospho-beta-glucosidase family protein